MVISEGFATVVPVNVTPNTALPVPSFFVIPVHVIVVVEGAVHAGSLIALAICVAVGAAFAAA